MTTNREPLSGNIPLARSQILRRLGWYIAAGRASVAIAAVTLIATVTATTVAAYMDALALLFVILLSLAGLAVAMRWPTLLFYGYCAAIPLNFALPPGPAGTVARVAGVIFFIGYLVRRPHSLHPSAIPLLGWVYLGWTLISCLWAVDTPTAFGSWLSLAQLFGITVLIASLVADHAETIGNALWSYTISASLTAAISIVLYMRGVAVFGRAVVFQIGQGLQDPALFASLVLPAAVFLVGEVQSRTTSGPMRTLALASLTTCAVALALSGTRSAWVGILAAIVVWLVVQREPRQALAVAALVCGVATLVAIVPGIGDFLLKRVDLSIATGGAGRTDIWAVGLSILASAPLLGVGFANFGVAFTSSAIAQAPSAGGSAFVGAGAHNVLLGALVETGLLGGVLLTTFLASAIVKPTGDRGNMIRMALISLYVQAMFLDLLEQKQLWLFLALAFGLASSQHLARVRGRAQPVEAVHVDARMSHHA